jgi:hypothetical protein
MTRFSRKAACWLATLAGFAISTTAVASGPSAEDVISAYRANRAKFSTLHLRMTYLAEWTDADRAAEEGRAAELELSARVYLRFLSRQIDAALAR